MKIKIDALSSCFLTLLSTFLCFNEIQAQVYGCTDLLATNYNPNAETNDGSCLYTSSALNPIVSWTLPLQLNETSGLIIWNNSFWTHNDDTDNRIYSIDTLGITNYSEYSMDFCVNFDWEEISQDDNYIYLGDFGNNVNGNRTNLKILRVDKTTLLQNNPVIDTINFSYSLQNDFSPTGTNNTNFDCEAFIVSSDSIYLFTKEWLSEQSTLYSLPKIPGNYIANMVSHYNVQGLITGSTYLENKKIVALSGYNAFLQPFIFLLYDFQNHNFFSGNKRKVSLTLPLHQVEGIASTDGLNYYISNERFSQSSLTTEAKLFRLDFTNYLEEYINSFSVHLNEINQNFYYTLSPIPAYDFIDINISDVHDFQLIVYNSFGQKIGLTESKSSNLQLNVSHYPAGLYFFVINTIDGKSTNGKFLIGR